MEGGSRGWGLQLEGDSLGISPQLGGLERQTDICEAGSVAQAVHKVASQKRAGAEVKAGIESRCWEAQFGCGNQGGDLWSWLSWEH